MQFNLFIYGTVGRRAELEVGMAGKDARRYRRMLDEIAELARLADGAGYFGFGHPEHHLQIEGFEAANDPGLMAMWLGRHSERLRIIPCGFVSTTNNPLVTAEKIATLDCMLGGRLGVGLVRGYHLDDADTIVVALGSVLGVLPGPVLDLAASAGSFLR